MSATLEPPRDDGSPPVELYADDPPVRKKAGTRPEPAHKDETVPSRVILTRADSVKITPVRWLWPDWLARGKLHLIAGAPGTGKTTIALAVAATLTCGGTWPDGPRAPVGTVVIWSGEDDLCDTLAPRLQVAGADMSRVHLIEGAVIDGQRCPFDPARDLPALAAVLIGLQDVSLIVVDPIVSAVAGDNHRNNEVRRGLQPLVDLGAHLGAAVLGVTHLTKGTAGRDPLERVTGSLAYGALARLVWLAARQAPDDDTPERRVLMRAKSNIGPDGDGFEYRLVNVELPGLPGVMASSVTWEKSVTGAAREVLADIEPSGDPDERQDRRDAAEWLRDLLTGDAVPVKAVRFQADAAGFSWRTMQRAMRDLGVVSKRGGFGQPGVWHLPVPPVAPLAPVAPVAPHKFVGANGEFGATGGADGVEI